MSGVPEISVIIPVFNREISIVRAVKSVIKQSYENWECLIIDDGSTDSTLERVRTEFSTDPRFKIIERPKTRIKGGGTCRNIGIEMAIGKYIAFLDSDDEWEPNKLMRQREFIRKLNSEKVVIYCQAKIFRKHHTIVLPSFEKSHMTPVEKYLFLEKGLMQTSTFFLHRHFAKKILFDENLARHQDYQFVITAEEVGACFRLIEDSLVKVYWNEDYNLEKRGWSPDVSYSFANQYLKNQMIKEVFIGRNILNACILNKMYVEALNIFVKYTYKRLHFYDFITMIKLLLLGLLKVK
ncbi:glycosyltransferase family 2 protein [Marinoscillum sp. 108]|uniref:glycosyltransferase family 2 protein n=1 Tax=Marinoscillum sp. 108 TaxID=2653151 RepID=UPI0012F09E06|nr:glycosyltransferase family 2 protein [Marinoscillum sp. 108]VXD19092.1 putative Glycosyl transferase family 2 [Marinoscillum sp. 108]